MITKHTPGPWDIAPYGPHAFDIIGGNRSIAIVNKQHSSNGNPTPDALLIAAAPELLGALQIWMKFFDTMPKGQFGGISCDIGLMNDGFIKSKRAIAKATGETK